MGEETSPETPAVSNDTPATPPLRPGTPEDVQPPAQPVNFQQNVTVEPPTRPSNPWQPQPTTTNVQWADALPGALVAGIVIAVASLLPLASFLLWPLAAGALAIVLYMRRRPENSITSGMGARVGAIAGLFGFVAFAIMMAVSVIGSRGSQFREALQQMMMQAAARNPNPEAQAVMQRMMSPQGIGLIVAFVFVVLLVMFIGFGAAGGAIGATLLRKRPPRS